MPLTNYATRRTRTFHAGFYHADSNVKRQQPPACKLSMTQPNLYIRHFDVKRQKNFSQCLGRRNPACIPDICHGRHGYVRVNCFGRCKFLQI